MTKPGRNPGAASRRSAVHLSPSAIVLAAAMLRLADGHGEIAGMSRSGLAAAAGLPFWRVKNAIDELVEAGIVVMRASTRGVLHPVWRIALSSVPAAPAGAQEAGSGGAATGTQEERNRIACRRALAALLKYHGDNPPDAESAAAVARIRAALRPAGEVAA